MSSSQPVLTISITAKLLNLHPRTIMMYEREGIFTPHRTDTKRRLFSMDDLNQLQYIKFLAQDKGLNIEGIRTLFEASKIALKGGIDLQKELFPQFSAKNLI